MSDVTIEVELDLDKIWNEIEESVRDAAREVLRDSLGDFFPDELLSLLRDYCSTQEMDNTLCLLGETFDKAVTHSIVGCLKTIKERV